MVEIINSIRMFLAFVAYKNFKVYQMDVKSTYLNGELEEEVYIEQPKDSSYQKIWIWLVDSRRSFMDSRKILELGM